MDLTTKIQECVDGLDAVMELFPAAADRYAAARYEYDQAKAREWKRILEESEKKPSDETMKHLVILAVAKEQKEERDAKAAYDSVKAHLQLVENKLSAYQTSTKFEGIGQRIAATGAYGN